MSKTASILFLIFAFCSCSNSDSKTITIGTFNIEWLGDGIDDKNPRDEEDFKNIAYVIRETEADILALQEIENKAALERILAYLPDYSYHLTDISGDQQLACLYKKSLIVDEIGEYTPLAFDTRLKPGLVLQLKKGKAIIPVLIVHFKATSTRLFTDDEITIARNLRYRQAMAVNHWADSVMNKAMRKELIILGDFNDYIKSTEDSTNTLLPLTSNKNLIFVTKLLNSCKYKKLKSIDHIVVSKALKRKLRTNSTRMFDFKLILPDSKTSKISDHCPVLLELTID